MARILGCTLIYFLTHSRGAIMARYYRRYGVINFLFDALMTMITCGYWLIWVFVREMRGRR